MNELMSYIALGLSATASMVAFLRIKESDHKQLVICIVCYILMLGVLYGI